MEAQKPAKGIMERVSYSDGSFWRAVACQCGNDEHNHEISVEVDDFDVSVYMYVNTHTRYPHENYPSLDDGCIKRARIGVSNFYRTMLHRIKCTWDIWFTGRIQYQADIILDKQQTINYSRTLQDAVELMEQAERKQNK